MTEELEIKAKEGSTKKRIRRARGNASGKGGESGRGHKGQKSRSGYSYRAGFEGGRMPLYKRIPKKRGLGNLAGNKNITVVNLSFLEENFDENAEVSIEALGKKVKRDAKLHILGNGSLTKSLKITAHKFSKTAIEKIEAAKGSFTIISNG